VPQDECAAGHQGYAADEKEHPGAIGRPEPTLQERAHMRGPARTHDKGSQQYQQPRWQQSAHRLS
jgi:hypothetical protein